MNDYAQRAGDVETHRAGDCVRDTVYGGHVPAGGRAGLLVEANVKAPYVGGDGRWISAEEDAALQKVQEELRKRREMLNKRRKMYERDLKELDEDIARMDKLLDVASK